MRNNYERKIFAQIPIAKFIMLFFALKVFNLSAFQFIEKNKINCTLKIKLLILLEIVLFM